MGKVTERQIRLLQPFLEGNTPTHNNVDKDTGEVTREWNIKCPLHDDDRRSASLNIDKGLFWCARCGGMPVTALIRRQEEWRSLANGQSSDPNLNGSAPAKQQRILSEGMIAGWHSALMSHESALQWLRERRGLVEKTVKQYEIGLDNGRFYTIPIRSPENDIWNVRYYNPSPRGEMRKIWSETGYGSPPRLYPMSVFSADPEEIILLGGEWDTLLTLQNDFWAVTRTAGEDVFQAEWGEWFKDRIVYLAHDCDTKGQKANRIAGRALHHIADVRIVQFPYKILPKHGKDMTDFILDNGADGVRALLEAAEPFRKLRAVKEVPTVSVLDTHDARSVGKPVRVVLTVKGRKEPGYTIPKVIQLSCTQDAGQKCGICPMRAAEGEATVEVAASDPLVLSMIEHPTSEMNRVVADAFGVPGGKCVKLVQEAQEHQAVEILFARPALDTSDGSEIEPDKAAQYKTIKVTSVGRHDTPPNNTVAVVGALQPNPRSQGNEFLAHDLQMLETSVDRFELNKASIALMRRFQGNRPLKKLAEINKSLADHVTLIQGRPEMHAMIDLTFHSVLSFSFAGELLRRGWLESLIIGDTGTGKSTAAQRLVQHFGSGEIVNCEAATFAGVIGGLQQLSGRDWAVTWGVVPLNDKRAVVLDEVSGLSYDEIASMSDIRSSGQAKLTKIQQEMTWARTRMLWMGNPRTATMANYTYGVDALRPLIGNAEDIARFDLAMAVTKYDVSPEIINQRRTGSELKYTQEACHTLMMWVWTRQPENIKWARGAERLVFEAANELGALYIEEPPLILASSVRIKIARVAVAIAARLFSTDAKYENVIVLPEHIEAAKQFINLLYGMKSFGYRERSREQLEDRLEAEQNKAKMAKYLKSRPMLAKFLRTAGKFRRQDLEEIMNSSKEEANSIISTLYEARMVRKVLGDIVVEPTLHELLREVK